MNPEPIAQPALARPPGARQPLLWAALAFAAGEVAAFYWWRPPLWWLLSALAFLAFTSFFVRRHPWVARALSLGALFLTGALLLAVRTPDDPGIAAIVPFDGGQEVTITGHVTNEGSQRAEGKSEIRQTLDVETEQIEAEGKSVAIRAGLRVNLYAKDKEAQEPGETGGEAMRAFRYGDRLRFVAKLNLPRNFGNPGAFDYRGYLAQNGIAALASTKTTAVEVLPGFSGSRLELWRTRIHRSITQTIHSLWPLGQAALVDAMVIGEDAFIARDTRVDFQRSGTYHILVVSGMNVGILAFVVFWVLRRLRMSELLASTLTVLLSVAYALLTDVGAPIWRATLMLALYLGARLAYRERCMLNALGAAALGLLVIDPRALFGASFQLTFLSVLLIAAIGVPVLERTLQPFRQGLRYLDSVT